MNLVIIESPYAGDIELNTRYARACLLDSLNRGEAPLASHLLYTQPGVLDDSNGRERLMGMEAGHAWIKRAEFVVLYRDLGVSPGMEAGASVAIQAGIDTQYRTIDGWLEKDAET